MKYATRKHTDHIVLHCSATPEGKKFTVKDIDRWHRQKGWNGVGYHLVVLLDGTVEQGRPIDAVGAHVEGWNSTSIGICYIGGVSADDPNVAKDTRTPAQKAALESLLIDLKAKYPKAKILGHRDFPDVKKACPCFDAKGEYAHILGITKTVKQGTHEVYSGDTLYSIARDNGLTLGELLELNPGVSTVIRPGQIIRVK